MSEIEIEHLNVEIESLGITQVEEGEYLNGESDYLKNVAEEVVNGVVEMSSGGLTSSSSADASPSSSSSHKAIIKPDEDIYNYDVVFPSLPSSGNNLMVTDVWNNASSKLSIKKHLTSTQVFHVPVEERRYKDVNFGGNETNKKSEEIAKKLGVKVEICCSKDQSLHIVISGNEEKVLEAKKLIISELQTVRDQKIRVPKEQHKYLIGKGGAMLKELQEKTCTQITIPKGETNSELITIAGAKDCVEQAIHEIQIVCEEQSKTSFERLNIPKLYHPWIRGFNGEIAAEIATRTGAKINIPPPQIEKDEIAVSGEREKVEAASAEIKRIYEEKSKLNITKLAIQITKSQHKLIIGKNGSTVQEIFKDFDVYVQVPRSDSPLETIYLFGEESKLGAALAQVCSKANSLVTTQIEAANWIHRYLIGEKGSNISKLTGDYPSTHVKFEADNKISLDGPPEEVQVVKERLEHVINQLKKTTTCEEVSVDSKYLPLVAGKRYENIARLNKEYDVTIRMPQEDKPVRIEGAPDAVQKAKLEFLELVKRAENERSKDIIIEQKYHPNLIGKSGKNLQEIRSKFGDVQINIPSQEEKSDVVTIRGNKEDVEKCFRHLQILIREMKESNYQDELQIFKQFHKMLIGKQGAFIRKIREDTNTRIDVPAEDADSESIIITGKQENVIKARKLIEEKVKELVKIEEDFVEVPHQIHTALIGKGGTIIQQVRKDCGGVLINFPPENTISDKITLKGPREEIEKAKKELLKLAKVKNDASYTEEVNAKQEYHKFLVGRKGASINALRDKHGVRIMFPSGKDNNNNKSGEVQSNNDFITIMGSQEGVKAAREELEATIKTLEEQVTSEITVDQKWHKNFTARRAKLINKISDDNCNVKISFPKNNTNIVTVKGPRDAVETAKKSILDLVYEFENQVTIELNIPQKYHVYLIGKQGFNSQKICDEFNVEINLPKKYDENKEEEQLTDGSLDIIKINGLKENCEKAKDALLALVPITEEFQFPNKYFKNLLENQAEALKELSANFNVQIKVPKKGEDVNYVSISGTKENIELAKPALVKKLNEYEVKSFTVEITDMNVDLIPQLRGRNGVEVIKLEKKFEVKIDFSRKGEPDKIVIKGVQKNVEDCASFIQKKISDDNSKLSETLIIDHRVHSRIIGQKGKNLAKIMDKYKVEIKFSGRNSDEVVVKGSVPEKLEDACEELKNLEEEYLQDVVERESYVHPSSKEKDSESKPNGSTQGFVVRGAPWESKAPYSEPVPDTNNMDDFPTISSTAGTQAQRPSWGPRR